MYPYLSTTIIKCYMFTYRFIDANTIINNCYKFKEGYVSQPLRHPFSLITIEGNKSVVLPYG